VGVVLGFRVLDWGGVGCRENNQYLQSALARNSWLVWSKRFNQGGKNPGSV
jgi:hypothetical protein